MRKIKRNLGEHEDYSPLKLAREHDRQELVKEYNRMREALRKNVQRIRQSGEFPDAAIIKTYQNSLSPSDMKSLKDADVALRLSELETAMSANLASLTGLRFQQETTIATLQERGYTGITKANFKEFTRFMESTRTIALATMRYRYTSRGIATGEDRNRRLELFNMAQQKNISTNALIRDFRFYVKHQDEIDKLPDREGGRKLGTKKIRELLKEEIP